MAVRDPSIFVAYDLSAEPSTDRPHLPVVIML